MSQTLTLSPYVIPNQGHKNQPTTIYGKKNRNLQREQTR